MDNKQAINTLQFLWAHSHLSLKYFTLSHEGKLSVNLLFKSNKTNELGEHIHQLIEQMAQDLKAAPELRVFSPFAIILLQKLIHLNPNKIIEHFNLVIPKYFLRKQLSFAKFERTAKENTMHHHDNLIPINHDLKTGLYTAPDDPLAHQHDKEASRIFIATQLERIKGFLSRLFAKIGIHFFENAPYEEHNYLYSDIYANDFAVDPYITKENSHFFIGHASNLINIRTETSPLHILTDPVEGDLNPLFYPRMTKSANKINNTNERMLPKVDVVLISHNHRDHVDLPTLKRLLNQQPVMVIPEGDMKLFKNLGFKHIVELKWWEQTTIKEQEQEILRITAVPTRHWSGRGLCDAHRSAFNGYVLQAPSLSGAIYFAGDTALMEESTSAPIFQHFNITTSIQPGGPDETRKEMQSTHQSSADALLMHFKILLAHYKKQGNKPELHQFLHECQSIKTIYNHTATFKLGNLRLRDTFYSVHRVLAGLKENEAWQRSHLTTYEYEVLASIKALRQELVFANNELLSDQQIIEILTDSIIIPKIGQRITLGHEHKMDITARHLILNKRILAELDTLTEQLLNQNPAAFSAKEFLITALKSYAQPWHATMTRNAKTAASHVALLADEQIDLAAFIKNMEHKMGSLNHFGHMHTIINYTKWLIEAETQDNPRQYIQDFFICSQVQRNIDKEIHSKSLSTIKKQKQEAFKNLAQQLAQTPKEKHIYAQTIIQWRNQLTNNPQGNILSQHRLFKTSKTHSESVIEKNMHILSETPNL